MVQQVKALADKPGGLWSMPVTCMVDGEKWLQQVILWLPHIGLGTHTHTTCTHACTPRSRIKFEKKIIGIIWGNSQNQHYTRWGKQLCEHAEQFRDMKDNVQDEHHFSGRPAWTCYSCLRCCSHHLLLLSLPPLPKLLLWWACLHAHPSLCHMWKVSGPIQKHLTGQAHEPMLPELWKEKFPLLLLQEEVTSGF